MSLKLAIVMCLSGSIFGATACATSSAYESDAAVRHTQAGAWTAVWGKQAEQKLDLQPLVAENGFSGIDEWTGTLVLLTEALGPGLAGSWDAAFYVLDLRATRCPGTPIFSSPSEVPDSLQLTEVVPITFFGLGQRVRLNGAPGFGGGGFSMDACGTPEAVQIFLDRRNTDLVGWIVRPSGRP